MPQKFNLCKQMESLLSTGNFYVKYPNKIEKDIYEESYYGTKIIDPDGKKRNLISERKKKIKNNTKIISFLKNIKPGKILDIGCGYGWILSSINKEWKKFGIEKSKLAATKASQYCEILSNDIEKFNTSKKFDVVLMIHVIEHLVDPEDVLKKVKKLIKKNGTLIIETPDFDCAAARRYKHNFRLLKDPTHISLFSQDSLSRMLRKYKFQIKHIHYPYFETEYFNKKNLLKILKKPNTISPPFYGSVMTFYSSNK